MRTVPTFLEDGSPVLEYSLLRKKLLPKGYLPPADGGHRISPIDLFVITQGIGIDNEPVYWLRGLDDHGKTMVGDMYYTIESARNFLLDEYDVEDASWVAVDRLPDQVVQPSISPDPRENRAVR